MSPLRIALIPVMVAALSGCAAREAGPQGPPPAQGVLLEVENDMPVNLRIYALYNGGETLLGRVDAMGQRSLRLPTGAPGTVWLVARPAAATLPWRRHVSEAVGYHPGQRIIWQIRASPSASNVPRISIVRVFGCTRANAC